MSFVYVAVGLMLLLIAGDLLVRGAVSLGLRAGIPAVIVGLTIVAFGTSAPELFVTIESVMEGVPGLAVGNVIGSNVFNLLCVLGIASLVDPLRVPDEAIPRDILWMLGVTIA
ncbi:MAG: sodium:calcium antiporter, partial [Pseudomonadota bacterium]